MKGPVWNYLYNQDDRGYWNGSTFRERSPLLLSGQNLIIGAPRLRQVRSEIHQVCSPRAQSLASAPSATEFSS
jgi:hypothetical protein